MSYMILYKYDLWNLWIFIVSIIILTIYRYIHSIHIELYICIYIVVCKY